jgi:hypothetical protein
MLYWPLSDLVTLMMVCIFICLHRKMRKYQKIGYQENERTSKNVSDLSKILKFFLFLSTYLVVYSIIVYIQARIMSFHNEDDNFNVELCLTVTKDLNVDHALWVVKRVFEFSAWRLPIMYILWPTKNKKSMQLIKEQFTQSEIEEFLILRMENKHLKINDSKVS